MIKLIDADALKELKFPNGESEYTTGWNDAISAIMTFQPTTDAVPVPAGGIGELSDGYHTFNGLYYQRMILFAVLVKTYKDYSWKSRRHSDGEPCFGGGWFIVGIDTPQGSYTYHYEDKYFDLFDCVELSKGKEWDGHTEVDVTRLLSLNAVPVKRGKWEYGEDESGYDGYYCSTCFGHVRWYGKVGEQSINFIKKYNYCPNCGADMRGEENDRQR